MFVYAALLVAAGIITASAQEQYSVYLRGPLVYNYPAPIDFTNVQIKFTLELSEKAEGEIIEMESQKSDSGSLDFLQVSLLPGPDTIPPIMVVMGSPRTSGSEMISYCVMMGTYDYFGKEITITKTGPTFDFVIEGMSESNIYCDKSYPMGEPATGAMTMSLIKISGAVKCASQLSFPEVDFLPAYECGFISDYISEQSIYAQGSCSDTIPETSYVCPVPTVPPTDPPTNPPTDPPTNPPTNPPTDPPTDPPLEPTDPPTDEKEDETVPEIIPTEPDTGGDGDSSGETVPDAGDNTDENTDDNTDDNTGDHTDDHTDDNTDENTGDSTGETGGDKEEDQDEDDDHDDHNDHDDHDDHNDHDDHDDHNDTEEEGGDTEKDNEYTVADDEAVADEGGQSSSVIIIICVVIAGILVVVVLLYVGYRFHFRDKGSYKLEETKGDVIGDEFGNEYTDLNPANKEQEWYL